MKKSDLKTGMVVEYRNGEKRIVLLCTEDGDVLKGDASDDDWSRLRFYNDDLTRNDIPEYDIVNVFQPTHIRDYLDMGANMRLVCTRETEKETQLKDLINKLETQLSEAKTELQKIKE